MIRQGLIDLVLFLLPFAVYAIYWRFHGRHRPDAHEKTTPWYVLAAIGLALVALSFLVWGLDREDSTEGVYVPPHVQDGRVVPGRVTPPSE